MAAMTGPRWKTYSKMEDKVQALKSMQVGDCCQATGGIDALVGALIDEGLLGWFKISLNPNGCTNSDVVYTITKVNPIVIKLENPDKKFSHEGINSRWSDGL